MTRAIYISLLCGLLHGAEPGGNAPRVLRFEEVLSRAVTRATAEDARLEITRDNLKLLEALGKARLELRPTLGLLAFSNPMMLAANIGTGLLFNHRTAPSTAVLESARFDILASELQTSATRVHARIEAARLYFDLLEKQEINNRSQKAIAARQERTTEVERLLNASRITAFDQIAFEQELLDLESQAIEARAQRKSTSTRLALLIGSTELDLQIEEIDLYSGAWDRPAPTLQKLLESATERRGELRLIREKIDSLRVPHSRKLPLESLSAGISQTSISQGAAANMAGYLLGKAGHGEITFSIPLRDTGEKAAGNELRLARIRFLETELRNIEDNIRAEVMALETEASASLERVRLSSRKLALARKAHSAVEARVSAGLAQPSAMAVAERGLLAAEWDQARSVNQRKSSMFTLFAVAGLDGAQTESSEQKQILLTAETGK